MYVYMDRLDFKGVSDYEMENYQKLRLVEVGGPSLLCGLEWLPL